MKLLINFGTLKQGGGQNVALNFLKSLKYINLENLELFFFVVENSALHFFLIKNGNINIYITPSNPLKRMVFELTTGNYLIRKYNIEIIYTYFGFGLFNKKIPQVCGVAVSNLFFPEINFWKEYKGLKLLKRKVVDKYRLWSIKKATALIFENRAMEKRSHSLFKISKNRTIYIPPSFTSDFENDKISISELNENSTKLLMLCGWQLNKNIMRVPEIASHLKKQNQQFQFIIAAPTDNSKEHQQFKRLLKKYEVEDMVLLIGPVKKEQLESLYLQIDFVLLMSKLESFSNNIIEAWNFKKPLIVTDAVWSKEICKNAAYYINREIPSQIAKALIDLKGKEDTQKQCIKNGILLINKYPSIQNKTKQEISFIEKIYHDNKKTN